MEILGPEKGSQIGPKRAPKKVGKEDTSKSEIFTFFLINLMKMLYFTRENGPRGPILLYFQKIRASGKAGKSRPMWPKP